MRAASNVGGGIIKAAAKDVEQRKAPATLKDWVQVMLPQLAKALPSVITPERFMRMVLTALSTTPKLAQCTRDSFLGAMMQAAQLGLEPNTPLGQAYLIPYNNRKKGVVECQFILGYKGLLDLAYRSGEVSVIQAHVVCEGDEFEHTLGLEPTLVHKPALVGRGGMIAVYAVFRTKSGGYGFEVMSKADVDEHMRRYSKAAGKGDSPWTTNYEEMAKKTVLKRVLKYAPVASEFVRAASVDEATLDAKIEGEDIYIAAEYEVDEDGVLLENAAPEAAVEAAAEVAPALDERGQLRGQMRMEE